MTGRIGLLMNDKIRVMGDPTNNNASSWSIAKKIIITERPLISIERQVMSMESAINFEKKTTLQLTVEPVSKSGICVNI
jgi:hypothetical protein